MRDRYTAKWHYLAIGTLLFTAFLGSCGDSSQDSEEVAMIDDGAAAAVETTMADSTATSQFASSACMKTHFPLAAEMTPPPEVRFYCAAPWNETTFRDFRASLDANGVDLAGLMIRGASPEQRSIMESVAPMALSQADQGPPGMGNIYRAQKVLPLLWAIHNGDGAEVLDQLDPSDLESLRKTQAMVNWEAPAIQGSVGVTTAQVGEQTKLSEIPGIILANDY